MLGHQVLLRVPSFAGQMKWEDVRLGILSKVLFICCGIVSIVSPWKRFRCGTAQMSERAISRRVPFYFQVKSGLV
jgi:hypothetical protein